MKAHRLIIASLTIVATVSLNQQTFAEQIVLDRIAAVVDEGVVMESDLRTQLRAIKARMASQGGEVPPAEVLEQQVLEHLIVQELQMQMAARAGVKIDDAEINQALDEIRRRNGLNDEQFAAQLQSEGLTIADLREDLRKELIVARVQRGAVGNRLDVTQTDIDNFLNSKEGQFWRAPEYHLGHILIAVSSGASDEDVSTALAKANDIREKAISGADFGQLATTYSAGQNALEGGDLGWRKPAQLPGLFAQQLEDAQAGLITEPFRSGAGFHILKVLEQRGGGEQMIEQTKVRHILVQPSVILSSEDARKLLVEVRQKILEGADFAEMAKEHSKDPGSMLSGGDLGWSVPGQFVPEFEQTMQETNIGEISEPFLSQHGWHILRVDDRREQDMSEAVVRNQALNLLRSRRFEEELPIWLQEIRDDAYVDIKVGEVDRDINAGS
ncbi:peptidylprolyl isomerase [Aurantivibrio plasticivorans]